MNEEPVVFSPDARNLIRDLALLLDIKITFFSEEMYEYLVGYHTRTSDFCTLIQSNLQVRYRCLEEDNARCKECRKTGESKVYRCHAGLTEIVIPLKVESRRLVYMLVGQLRMDTSPPPSLVEEWKRAGFDEEQLSSSYLARPFFTKEKLSALTASLMSIVTQLLQSGQIAIRKPALIEEIQLYIDTHIGGKITIGEVAESVCLSESALSHAVKREIGISFKEFLTERRISAFQRLRIINPSLSIKECSRRVGYEDPLYFSRLYRKKTGAPPSSFAIKEKPLLPEVSIYQS